MPSRVMEARRLPTRLAGIRKMGNSASAISVSFHSRVIRVIRVANRVITLETTVDNVPVSARCAPITSLFMRLVSAPVRVREKNPIGIR